jgi:hypothetical protein
MIKCNSHPEAGRATPRFASKLKEVATLKQNRIGQLLLLCFSIGKAHMHDIYAEHQVPWLMVGHFHGRRGQDVPVID